MTVKLLPLLYKMAGHAAYLVAGFGIVIGVDFQNKITLGSLLVAAVLIILAGIFTIRSKIATIWREEAEGERAAKERCQEELAEERERRAEFEREQQELRHALKNQVVGLEATIKVLEAKTDLSAAVEKITATSESSGQRVYDQFVQYTQNLASRAEARDGSMLSLLKEIRDKLPSEPIKVQAHDVIPVHETERRKS